MLDTEMITSGGKISCSISDFQKDIPNQTKSLSNCFMEIMIICHWLWCIIPLELRMMIILESDAGILGKKKSECSYQESNLRPSDY